MKPRADPFRSALRVVVLGTVVIAPWAIGAVQPRAYWILLAVAYACGLASWARGHWGRAHGEDVPRVPAAGWLLALLGLGLVQLVPVPEGILRFVSPGSHAFASFVALGGIAWQPVSVSPPDTLRAVAFVGGLSLLYGFAYRELRSRTWRLRAAGAVVTSAALMSVEALIQATSSSPTTIYGLLRPRWDWAVFGPFVNKNQFGGYVALAFPVALAWSMGAFAELRRAWSGRRGFLALGDPAGTAWLSRTALVALLAFSLIACRSRGALLATVVAAIVGPLAVRRRGIAVAASAVLALGVVVLVGVEALAQHMTRGASDSRLGIWRNSLQMAPDFPILGSGLNTFPLIFMRYQEVSKREWINAAHNDYVQALTDGGVVGLCIALALTTLLLKGALRAAQSGILGVGLLGSVLASCTHALVDFNWQIPGVAATFALLAGLAMQPPRLDPQDPRS